MKRLIASLVVAGLVGGFSVGCGDTSSSSKSTTSTTKTTTSSTKTPETKPMEKK